MLILQILLFVWFELTNGGNVADCAAKYAKAMSQIVGAKFEHHFLNRLKEAEFQTIDTSTKIIIEIGHGARGNDQLFSTFKQLNITGISRLGITGGRNCGSGGLQLKKLFSSMEILSSGLSHVFLSSAWDEIAGNWWNIAGAYPKQTFFIFNENDSGFTQRIRNESSCMKDERRYSPPCTVPVPFRLDIGNDGKPCSDPPTFKDTLLLVNDFSYDHKKCKSISTAYRNFAECLVPPEHVLHINKADEPKSSTEFWADLTSFLDIPLSSESMSSLVEGGVLPVTENIHEPKPQCDGDHAPCITVGVDHRSVIFPSVCSISQRLSLTTPFTAAKGTPGAPHTFASCAVEYSDEIARIFGSQFRDLVTRKMLSKNIVKYYDDKESDHIVLGIGPGSTGTTSLFMAMKQLNVTSYHYNVYSKNCSAATRKMEERFKNNFIILKNKNLYSEKVFWGDSPVPGLWWQTLLMYPNSKIIVTDIHNDDDWFEKRLKDHCNRKIKKNWDPCTVPLAFEFPMRVNNSLELYHATHLTKTTAEKNKAAFAAYRKLISCAVPERNLLWIKMKDQKSSPDFWNTLINFLGVSVPKSTVEILINAGVPRVSQHSGCTVGGKACQFYQKDKDSFIIPSVCMPQ